MMALSKILLSVGLVLPVLAVIMDPQKVGSYLQKSVPRELGRRLVWLPDESRSMGIHIVAGKGSGKSRMMGRVIAWLDFLFGVPQVILDPVGTTIDNFLDKLIRLPREYQEYFAPRILYVDMSGRRGHIVPMPLYYRLGNESLAEIANRLLQAIRRVDPFLVTASVEGWNALLYTGTYAGMVLAALDLQITEAEDLLLRPESWKERLGQALSRDPESFMAVDFFENEYAGWNSNMRRRNAAAFRNKISLFTLDPAMRAIFGANKSGIEWDRVETDRLTVLLDFRGEHDPERRRFKMLWSFSNFLEYIKWRGPGRHQPMGFIIDELTALTHQEIMGESIFANDIDELVNMYSRNYMIWPTIAHQEMWQVNEYLQKTLLTMGTQIVGSTSNMASALAMGQHFYAIDPYRVKRVEKVLMTPPMSWPPVVVDLKPVEFSIEEQIYASAYHVKNQPRFHFLVRPARREGDVMGEMVPITIENIDPGQWPDGKKLMIAREQLMARSGRKIADILAEIDARGSVDPSRMGGMPSLPGDPPRSGQLFGD